jgi:stage II sporulation protein D
MPAHGPLSRILLGLLLLTLAAPQANAKKQDLPEAPGRYRFVAAPGETLLVHGTYPPSSSSCVNAEQPVLHERYRGTVEVVRASDGDLYVIGELAFEDYLRGIAEVPRDWPMEALKAQVVAARTYAAAHLDPGGAYDLCATDACQVYMGMGIEAGPWGHRWAGAVEETEGQILLHGGDPATTFYFSTSNGRTYDNEHVFGGAPLSYLRGQPETDDGASPVSRWTARFPLGDLARFLAADGLWSGRPIRSVRQDAGHIALRGSKKRSRVVLGRAALRDALNDWAACLDPARYPTREPGGYRLPQAVPSVWFRASQDGDELVIEGQGWGHGVGMVQWGAYGKAKRGLVYPEILAAYYGGLRPQAVDLPGTVRVLLATDLTSVTVAPSGEARLGAGRQGPTPPWRLTGGRRLRIHHGPLPPAVLEAVSFTADRRATPGEPLQGHLRLSASSRVRLRFAGHGGTGETPWQPFHEGVAMIEATTPSVAPGRYRVRAIAWDGVDVVSSGSVRVRVTGASEEEASPSPSPIPSPTVQRTVRAAPQAEPSGNLFTVAAVGAGAALLLGLLLTLRRRKRLHRS